MNGDGVSIFRKRKVKVLLYSCLVRQPSSARA